MSIARVRVEWNGLTGLPGISTFYVGTTDADITELKTFFDGIKNLFPNNLTWTVPTSGDVIDEATGELEGTIAFLGAGSVTATGASSSYAAGVGCRVVWNTGAVVNGRRVTGTTFLTHLSTTHYDTTGTLSATAVTTAQSAAAAFVASGSPWGIWHRPNSEGPGSFHALNSSSVPDRVSWVRTRKV